MLSPRTRILTSEKVNLHYDLSAMCLHWPVEGEWLLPLTITAIYQELLDGAITRILECAVIQGEVYIHAADVLNRCVS